MEFLFGYIEVLNLVWMNEWPEFNYCSVMLCPRLVHEGVSIFVIEISDAFGEKC